MGCRGTWRLGVWAGTCEMRSSSLSRGWGQGSLGDRGLGQRQRPEKAWAWRGGGQSGALRGVMGSWGLEERGNVCRVRGPGDEVGRGCWIGKPQVHEHRSSCSAHHASWAALSSVTTATWGHLSRLDWTIYFPRAGGTCLPFKTGIPNLQDQMLDELRWSCYNNNRNKVHSKCAWIIPRPPAPTLVDGNTVFYETIPWCRKGWGLLP